MHRASVCTYVREIIDSYERMGRGGVDIGKIVSECSLGRNIAVCLGQCDGDMETHSNSYTASPFVRLSSAHKLSNIRSNRGRNGHTIVVERPCVKET